MDLTFQVPMQYCSLQLSTLFPSPVTFTSGYCFCFGSVSSFFLGLFLYSYWAPTNLGSSSFNVIFFAFSYCSWGSQGKNTEVVCHSFSCRPQSVRTKLVNVMEFQLSYFISWKMMLWKCCTQYASKSGKPNSSHRTGKGHFSFQCQIILKLVYNYTHLTF